MKTLHPAEIRTEPATTPGMPFLDAAGRRCLWPLSGSGAEMVVCGERRTPGSSYCQPHREQSGGSTPPMLKPRLPRV